MYEPKQVPEKAEERTAYLATEFREVANAFQAGLARAVEFLHVAPLKPREGMIRGADGSDWNPGLNKGVYVYYNGAWNKLGYFEGERAVANVAVSTALTDAHGTVIATVDGLTITLPAASAARVGRIWRIVFGTTGTCTVQCAGSDTFPAVTSAAETTLVLVSRGSSVAFQCVSPTTWAVL